MLTLSQETFYIKGKKKTFVTTELAKVSTCKIEK